MGRYTPFLFQNVVGGVYSTFRTVYKANIPFYFLSREYRDCHLIILNNLTFHLTLRQYYWVPPSQLLHPFLPARIPESKCQYLDLQFMNRSYSTLHHPKCWYILTGPQTNPESTMPRYLSSYSTIQPLNHNNSSSCLLLPLPSFYLERRSISSSLQANSNTRFPLGLFAIAQKSEHPSKRIAGTKCRSIDHSSEECIGYITELQKTANTCFNRSLLCLYIHKTQHGAGKGI